MKQSSKAKNAIPTLAAALLVLSVGLLLFRDFVFGNKLLLYTDIGSDSVNIFYPHYVLRSDYIRQHGMFSWSFQVGMGQDIFPFIGTLVLVPVVWLGKHLIATALVYQHLFYIALAGLFSFRFFNTRGLSFKSSSLGALLLSFSAYMCMGSCWYFNAIEMVCFLLLLLAAEVAIVDGRWVYLVFAVSAVALLGAFHLYLCALFLSLYVPARLVERRPSRSFSILPACAALAAVAVLGVGLSAIVTVNSFYALRNSPRGVGAIFNTWSVPGLLQLDSATHYLTSLLRPFSNDILGTGNDFRGWKNYLEAPISYCGLLPLLILPQVFVGAHRRQRILYAALLIFVVLPVVFPWFRYLFWLFQGGYYRTFSLFSILGIVTLSVTAFSRFERESVLNLWLLAGTCVALIGILYFPIAEIQRLVEPDIRRTAAIFLVLYAAILATGQILKKQSAMAWAIVILVAIELIHFDGITVSSRPVVTKDQLQERIGYNDETVDAIRDIKATDSGFFRLTKTWGSGPAIHASLNDAMVFGYYGTSCYSSFNNLNYINFLIAAGALPQSDLAERAHWSKGLEGHRLLSAFAGEKYVLTKNPARFETAGYYEHVKAYRNDVHLLHNQLFLPLGLSFSRCISESMLSHLPDSAKPLALLHTVVLSDQDLTNQSALAGLTMSELQQKITDASPPEIVAERRRTALNLRSFTETSIEGNLQSDQNVILVIQTPFDRGWRASVDGRPVPAMRVDAGLLGVPLNKGSHKVELLFRTPLLYLGAMITLISCGILGWTLWKWPRLRLQPT